MSPKLRGQVAAITNNKWITRVWYLPQVTEQLQVEVAMALRGALFAPEEVVECPAALCIVAKGLIGRAGRLLHTGSVWGEDLLLQNPSLRRERERAVALTYVQ